MKKLLIAGLLFVFPVVVFAERPPKHDRNATTTLSCSGTNASAAVVQNMYYRIACDGDVYLNEGAAATTSKELLKGKVAQYFTAVSTTVQCITSGAAVTCGITQVY